MLAVESVLAVWSVLLVVYLLAKWFVLTVGACWLCVVQVWTGLLLVDTAPVKETLAAKSEAAVEALLGQLLQKSIEQYEHVCKRCEVLSEEVMREATDTRLVLELKVCWLDAVLGSGE